MPNQTNCIQADLRIAFDSLHWIGWTLEAAMQHTKRRRILQLIATHHLKKMDTIISVSRIEHEASRAARLETSGEDACPWPLESSAGKLFLLMFEVEYLAVHKGQQGQVEQEALLAAEIFDDVNDACPYPFDSPYGQLFKRTFLQARTLLIGTPA